MKKLNSVLVDQSLILLGEILAFRKRPPHHFVVCGGSSLLALSLVSRSTTKDVDILAKVENRELKQPKPLPDWFLEDAKDVQSQLDLPENWINDGPADDLFFRFGLPEGIESRLTGRAYGDCLKISFISRYDQIFFKLYAAVDQSVGSYHYHDLTDLKPTEDELKAAISWIFKQDDSEGFRMVLREVLNHLGFGGLGHEL